MVTQTDTGEGSTEQDWRMQAELDVGDRARTLNDLIARLRGSNLVEEIEASVPHNVVITHDGRLLFAYAAAEATLTRARKAIESVLDRDGIKASVRISHWDDELDEWRQTDPPATPAEKLAEAAAEREAEAIETRTMVASAGKLVRAEFEQSMLDSAETLGLECKIVEHPHLLRAQLAFTVTGPKRKIDEFAQGLIAEGWATIRTETAVMLSPL